MDRRTFVRVCAGAGGAVTLGAAGFGVASGLARPRGAPTRVRYIGAHKIGGPAPRGVPYIPIEARGGLVHGRTTLQVGGREWDTLRWLAFCGHQGAPGLDPSFKDDGTLRYHLPEVLPSWIRPWYADRVGEPVRVDDFPDEGFGARFTWRGGLTGVIVKLRGGALREPEEPVSPGRPLEADERSALASLGAAGLVAASNLCTHFCCEAGYKEAEELARARDAWDALFCACHAAVFDLHAPVAYEIDAPEGIGPLERSA